MDLEPVRPGLELLCRIRARVDAPQRIGTVAGTERRIVPILGGTVSGPRIEGRILPGGSDWQEIDADGTARLEARYAIETGDGALIAVINRGIRHGAPEVIERIMGGEAVDPALYYFRSTPRFETAAPRWNWLNRIIAVGSCARTREEVLLDFYEVK